MLCRYISVFHEVLISLFFRVSISSVFRASLSVLTYETKNEVRVKQYGLSSVKKNELGDAGIGKIVIVRGSTDSEYEVGSAHNSQINSTILQALTFIRDQKRGLPS